MTSVLASVVLIFWILSMTSASIILSLFGSWLFSLEIIDMDNADEDADFNEYGGSNNDDVVAGDK